MSEELKRIMGENISYYLKRIGKSQRDMARDLNIPDMTISNWVKGKTYPRIDKIQLMATYFGIKRSDLIEDMSTNIEKPQDLDEYLQRKSIGYTLAYLKKEIENLRKFIEESADIQTKKMLRLRLEDLEKDYTLFLEIEKEL